MDMNVKIPENLTEEQKNRLKAAKSQEELLELMQEMGIELTDDQLEGLAGGRERCFGKYEHYES